MSPESPREDSTPLPAEEGSTSKEGAPSRLKAQFLAKREKKLKKKKEALLERGIPEEHVDRVLAQQEYASAPLHVKLRRLEAMVTQSMQNLAQEMVNLRHNDEVLADAMDANFRAVARGLEKAGVSLEDQNKIMQAVQEELKAEAMARAEEQEKAQEASEKEPSESEVDVPGEPPPPPEEALTFGG